MSLKTLAVCDIGDLKDGQLKEVPFEQGKVLLSRIGDKVHATSAFCTHYGAPLVKGVLTSDERVVCPWHGACFNVCTGDIEDAPAPSALHSFKTHISEGKVHVTADPVLTTKNELSRPPTLKANGYSATGHGVVIVGGGSGAFHCIESLREHGFNGPITVLSKEPHAPIDRTKLSKALITDASKLEWRSSAELKHKYGVNLRTGVNVTSVDPNTKSVSIGEESVRYEILVLAPGATPRRLPVSGADLPNVLTFRGIADSIKVQEAVKPNSRVVVIGSSFISMEIVVALSTRLNKESDRPITSIDVVGMEKTPFEAILGRRVGHGIQKFHQSKGVKFHMSSTVEHIVPDAVTIKDSVSGVTTKLPADVIIMGVGVAPATEFLKTGPAANIWKAKLERDGGLRVDELLRVEGLEDQNVFAIGDIAAYPQPGTGERRRIEHWNVAGNHGRAVGKTIAGSPQPFVKIPVFWSAQGQQLRYCGVGAGYDDVIIQGDPDELKFVAFYVNKGQVVSIASMQNDPVVSKASELLRLGKMPTEEEIRAGKDILAVDISSSGQI